MQFTKNETEVYEECRLKRVERNYIAAGRGIRLDNWHYRLKDHVDPYHVYNILGIARWNKELNAIVFPNTKQGKVWRDFAKDRLAQDISAAIGEQRYVLEGEKLHKYITRDELMLMFRLMKETQHRHVDSYAELAAFRGQQ